MTGRSAVVGLVLAIFVLAGSLYLMGSLVWLHGEPLAVVLVAWAIVLTLVTIKVLRLRRRLHVVVDRFGGGGWAASTFTDLGPIIILGAWLLPLAGLALSLWLAD